MAIILARPDRFSRILGGSGGLRVGVPIILTRLIEP